MVEQRIDRPTVLGMDSLVTRPMRRHMAWHMACFSPNIQKQQEGDMETALEPVMKNVATIKSACRLFFASS